MDIFQVDGMVTVVISAAFDLREMGRRANIALSVPKQQGEGVCTCNSRDKKHRWQFRSTIWKRRLGITARTAMMCQAHYALRKHLADDL